MSEFLLYFPQLIAGPILRANELIPSLKKKIIFINENIRFGILLFAFGFVKKIFFADSIGNFIDPIFEKQSVSTSEDFLKAFLLFPLQIYFDFSGYVDMALGISKILSITSLACFIFIVFFIFIITIAPITKLTETAAIALGN